MEDEIAKSLSPDEQTIYDCIVKCVDDNHFSFDYLTTCIPSPMDSIYVRPHYRLKAGEFTVVRACMDVYWMEVNGYNITGSPLHDALDTLIERILTNQKEDIQ